MTLKGSFEIGISGDGENGVYGNFLESLQNLKDSTAITQKAEEFYCTTSALICISLSHQRLFCTSTSA